LNSPWKTAPPFWWRQTRQRSRSRSRRCGADRGCRRRAGQTFEAALDKIRPAAQAIIQKLRALHDPPDEIEVEFGLKLNAQAGAFIAAAGTEANYRVTLTWKREEKKQ